MTVQVSYPGVYIQEIPSGVRSIASVATSITAFVGRARLGPVGQPVTCFSFGDFQRSFGGLDPNRPLSYSVRDFFNNGGGRAVIVRLFEEDGSDGVARLTAGGNLDLVAANPGAWGDAQQATVSTAEDQTAVQAVSERYGLNAADMFDLTIVDTTRDVVETFANVSVADRAGARRVDRVLEAGSNLMRVSGDLPGARPADEAGVSASGGGDGVAVEVLTYQGNQEQQTGIFALEKTDLFNLMVLPPDTRAGDTDPAVLNAAANYCQERRAMLIVDPPAAWATLHCKSAHFSSV